MSNNPCGSRKRTWYQHYLLIDCKISVIKLAVNIDTDTGLPRSFSFPDGRRLTHTTEYYKRSWFHRYHLTLRVTCKPIILLPDPESLVVFSGVIYVDCVEPRVISWLGGGGGSARIDAVQVTARARPDIHTTPTQTASPHSRSQLYPLRYPSL